MQVITGGRDTNETPTEEGNNVLPNTALPLDVAPDSPQSSPAVPAPTNLSSASPNVASRSWDGQDLPLGRLPSELRIGLAMCGGIALTLYEAGVSHELYRFYRAWSDKEQVDRLLRDRAAKGLVDEWNPYDDPAFGLPDYDDSLSEGQLLESRSYGYLKAFQAIPLRPVVDVLTGASAGGINSIFLASSIATGQDFGNFHDIWIDTADIGQLRYTARDKARALLNTRELREQMTQELTRNMEAYAQSGGSRVGEAEPDLFVRLCRTHQAGHLLRTLDTIGHQIEVERKEDVINFRTRHFRPRYFQGKPDESVNRQQIEELTQAALATSAFPGLFPPVFDKTEGRWYVDGGLWDNQPIDLAVEVIRDKPAFARTHRCLFFVEPNPTQTPVQPISVQPPGASDKRVGLPLEVSNPEPEPAQATILQSLLFMGLKGSVWPALSSILGFNQRNKLYENLSRDATAQEFAKKLGQQQWQMSHRQLRHAKRWLEGNALAQLASPVQSVSPTAGSKPANQRNIAPATIIPKLMALNEARLYALLFDNDATLIQQWNALLVRLGWKAGFSHESAADRTTTLGQDDGRHGSPSREAAAVVWTALALLEKIGFGDMEEWLLQSWMRELNRRVAIKSKPTVPMRLVDESRDGIADNVREVLAGPMEVSAYKALLYARLEQIDTYLRDDGSEWGDEAANGDEAVNTAQTANYDSLYRLKSNSDRSRFRPASEAMLQSMSQLFESVRNPVIPETERRSCLTVLQGWVESVSEAIEAGQVKSDVPGKSQSKAMPQDRTAAQTGLVEEAATLQQVPTSNQSLGLGVSTRSEASSEALGSSYKAFRADDWLLRDRAGGLIVHAGSEGANEAAPGGDASLTAKATNVSLYSKSNSKVARSPYNTLRLYLSHPEYSKYAIERDRALWAALGWLQIDLNDAVNALTGAKVADVHLDIAQYILSAVSELNNKTSIDLIRISGNDTLNEHLIPPSRHRRGTAAQRKLAGEGLGHISGFLENRWRRNDYIWGRLDACEILLRTLRYYGEREPSPGFTMSDEEYEKRLQECQTAILRQEAALYKRWYQRIHGEEANLQQTEGENISGARSKEARVNFQSRFLARQCGGVPATSGQDPAQQANAQIIGHGWQSILEADEPGLTINLNYLIQQLIRVARGDRERLPAQLESVGRLARLMSYVLPVIVKLLPLQVHQRNTRNTWRWLAFMAILLLLTGGISYLLGAALIGNLAILVTRFFSILAIGLVLIAVGGMLGWRRVPWAYCLAFLGFGGGIVLGIGEVPLSLRAYKQTPGILLLVSVAGLLTCALWGAFRYSRADENH